MQLVVVLAVVLAVVFAVRSPARVGLNRSKLTIIIIVVNPQVGDRQKAEQEVLLKSFVFSINFWVIFLVCYFAISSTPKNGFLKSIAPIVTKPI